MTNSKKKQYLIEYHKLYSKHQLYPQKILSDEELSNNEDKFWNGSFQFLREQLPKRLYKYRRPSHNSFDNFEKDQAWFSLPSKFDDTIDTSINNDIETEIKKINHNYGLKVKELAKDFAHLFVKKLGCSIDEKMIEEVLPFFKSDLSMNRAEVTNYLNKKYRKGKIDKIINQLEVELTKAKQNIKIKSALVNIITSYIKTNEIIQNKIYSFSLSEKPDIQAMWSYLADESKGFCIEYEFPENDLLGRRMLLNMLPVYYGKRDPVSFLEIIGKCIKSGELKSGTMFKETQKWLLSESTKDKSYSFQKEWRISFSGQLRGNVQRFPFAKSIIIGERMENEYKDKLIEAAKKKKIAIYQRELNITSSKIKVVRIF